MSYADIDALNWSSLKHLATSPRLFHWRRERPQEDSRSMLLGRAIHAAVLEPEHFAYAYACAPDFGDGRTKEAKAAKAAWLADLRPGCEVLDADDYQLATRVATSVAAHRAASDALRGAVEQTITWVDEETRLECKARLDVIALGHVCDLKSTRVGTIAQFSREVAQRLYHGQLAWYVDGAIAAGRLPRDAHAVLVAAQTTEPYDVAALRLSADALARGRALYRQLLRRYVECVETERWPGIADEVVELDLPTWAAGDSAEDIW